MYLSRLEIFGFKSFANRTVINFTKGITGIVGPNGCGKTNIVDALRWSLGEQKSHTLRSDKMENVIFNGTKDKKAMGMAEVSLTLVNDDNTLPTEYNEVTITRRIFRSGESEYLLNKNICRLKDITNLFMDTGMGTNAYSVIELKMIETILSSKAEERRKMFEEAAGVNKYKLRRRLALKKLEEVKGDLTRVNDIVSEVEKQVRSLERQAKKADKYTQLQSVLREKEVDLAEREFTRSILLLQSLNKDKTNKNERKTEIDNNIRNTESELIVYRDQITEIDRELREKRREIASETEKLHNVQKNISVSQERKKSLEMNLQKYKAELEELHIQNDEVDEVIIINNDKIEEFQISIERISGELEGSEEKKDEKRNAVEEKRAVLKIHNDEVIEINKNESNINSKLNTAKRDLNKLNDSITAKNNKIQNVTNDIAKTVGYLENLDFEKKEASEKLKESEALYVEKQNEKENLEKQLSKLKENELEAKGAYNSLKDKIEFLSTLITNLEGVSKGSKVLIESEGWTDKEKTLFADVGNTDDEYRFALEAALKSVLNNLLLENFNDLKKAIDYLRKNDLGKASFYMLEQDADNNGGLLNKIQNYLHARKVKKLETEEGFLHWADTLVQAENKWAPYFAKVLKNTVVTNDLESALLLREKYPAFNFATLNGDFVQNNGVVEAGSLPKLDDTLFGRKKLLDELKNEFPSLEAKIAEIRNEIDATEEKISSIDLKVISDEGKILLNEVNSIEKQIAQMDFEKNKASEDIDKTQSEIQELAQEINRLNIQIDEFNEELNKITANKEESEANLAIHEKEVKELEEDLNQFIGEQNQKNLELERTKGQLENSRNAITRAKQNKETIRQTISKRERDIETSQEEIYSITNVVEDAEIEYDEISGVRQSLVNKEEEIDERLKAIKSEASTYEKQLREFRTEREQISDSVHSIDIKMNEQNLRLENLQNHIKEEYQLDLTVKEFEDLDSFNFKERNYEVADLKNQLKNLGPINLLAYEEYEQEKERMDFLHKQRNDLIDSEKDLVHTIQEINDTAQNLFAEVFEQIRKNFVKIFQGLFNPGDEADLKLEEDIDPLEAKIEIMAKPKGKRPTSIELLSGGEKTLTATALLFAIYLVKPSPFCILDEVDAPLDDANVGRFTRLIKDFSVNTQFIMVTHNKRTMEAAENMYGVTMMDEGVSKLAAVQFNDQLPVQ